MNSSDSTKSLAETMNALRRRLCGGDDGFGDVMVRSEGPVIPGAVHLKVCW